MSRTIQRAEEELKPAEANALAIDALLAADEAEAVAAPPPPPTAAATPEEKKLGPKAKPSRKEKQAAGMVWNDAVVIGMPSKKHILEEMSGDDMANKKQKVSVVQRAVAAAAVIAIQAHVRAHGWNTAGAITMEPTPDGYKVTFNGNEWMTHTGSGQLWPLRGRDVFSPPLKVEVKKMLRRWKDGGTRPASYMG